MTAIKPYPSCKPSGVPWLDDVPAGWDVLPGRACFREKHTPNTGMLEKTVLSLSFGRLVVKPPEKLHGLVPASFETYQIVEPGDIVCRPTDLQNDWNSLRFGFASTRGIITSAYMNLSAQRGVSPQYGYSLLNTYDLLKVFYGLGSGLRQNLDWSDFKYLPCLVPSSPEQAAIVRYLNHMDRRIRKYVRAKLKLIGLLNEQKQAIIHKAVTSGLDPNVKLKPSGVPWLGDIPECWETTSSKRLFTVREETAFPGDEQLSATQAYGVISQEDFERKVGRRVVHVTQHLEKRRHVERDDFVISMRSFQGGLERAWAKGCIRSSYVVLRPTPKAHVGYFARLFKSYGYIRALQATCNFIRDGQDLNFNHFCIVDLPVVPMQEQKAIASFLDQAAGEIDAACLAPAARSTSSVSIGRGWLRTW